MVIVKNTDGNIVPKDGFDSGQDTTDDTWMGGLLGAAVGILGGPIGILLGGGVGLLAGSLVDESDAADNTSLLTYSSRSLLPGQTALIALVQEDDSADFDMQFDGMDCAVMHWDAAEIADEVDQADQIQKELAKEAREKLRASARQTGTRQSRRSAPRSSRSSRISRRASRSGCLRQFQGGSPWGATCFMLWVIFTGGMLFDAWHTLAFSSCSTLIYPHGVCRK